MTLPQNRTPWMTLTMSKVRGHSFCRKYVYKNNNDKKETKLLKIKVESFNSFSFVHCLCIGDLLTNLQRIEYTVSLIKELRTEMMGEMMK